MKKWDPLEISKDSADELLSAARKREIRNILKSYVGRYDCFCELIQNAMDAVDTRANELKEDNYLRKIWIKINLKENTFSITDNGIGFKEEEFKTFLCPSHSFKNGAKSRGNKGVGATYIAYGYNYLQLGTKTPDYSFIAEIKDGRKWVEDDLGKVTRPHITESQILHDAFNHIDRGSTFTIRFGGKNTRPKQLTYFSADTADKWRNILLIKTPLGHISLDKNETNPITFDLEVIDSDDNITLRENLNAEYIYPHTVITSSIDLDKITSHSKNLVSKERDHTKLPHRFQNQNALYKFFDSEKIKELLRIKQSDEEMVLLKDFSPRAYGYFCYSTKVWDEYNDRKAKLRKGDRILRGGLQLATKNMPQGELITIPLTSNIGYQKQSHIIVLFENAEPDLGRKGFQPDLKEFGENIAVAIVNHLKSWRHSILRKDSGGTPSIIKDIKLNKWIKEQENYQKTNPINISNNNFFIPVNELSMYSEPKSEQDVIVLFNQLIAGGVIRSIKHMATHSHTKYDGLFRYNVQEPLKHHIFDKKDNPLGIQEYKYDEPIESPPYVLEYKLNMDDLIEEFDSEEKYDDDIKLVIVWDVGCRWKERYTVTSLLDLDNLQQRDFHGITHIFIDDNTNQVKFCAVILSELIDYLNHCDRIQKEQKEKYGDII